MGTEIRCVFIYASGIECHKTAGWHEVHHRGHRFLPPVRPAQPQQPAQGYPTIAAPAGAAPAQGDGRQELADRLHPSVPQISRAKLLWLIDEVRSPASAPAASVPVSAIRLAHHRVCTCGGAGPDEGCAACDMYHELMALLPASPATTGGDGDE